MRLLFLLIIAILLVGSPELHAQVSTPLAPVMKENKISIGIIAGIGLNFQTGAYLVDCEGCSFESGDQFGYSFGAIFDHKLSENFSTGIFALFENRGVNSYYEELESFYLEEIDETIKVRMSHESALSLSYINAVPYFAYRPVKFLTFRMGLSLAIPLSSNVTHDQSLLTDEVTLSSGEVMKVDIAAGGTQRVQDSEVTGLSNPVISLLPVVAAHIPLERNVFLSPQFHYNLPFNTTSTYGEDFKLHTWRFMMELGMAFYT
ncbi:MAG: hypothetical protein ACLFR2_11665, partial [Candidatus Kapaibacterium sp.]